jgi:signal transduction histidine kinase
MTLVIADTGIGIARDDIARALTPFGQVESSLARRYEGAGLGLPLTRALVERHGGTMVLESEPGKGTRVYVRLPRERVIA